MTEETIKGQEEKKQGGKRAKKKALPSKVRPKRKAKFNMVTTASARHVRISPRKARVLIDMIRGKQVEPALQALKFNPRKGAAIALKVLRSAISNAKEQSGVDIDSLWVIGGHVNFGRTMMRFMPRAQGRATPIRKRSAHITLMLGERV